ncbi:HEAT repeats domain-containing protein [Ditylenchus destructor]|nr:HEAT repeats domain-containing protein [Ditylenchus destructor]
MSTMPPMNFNDPPPDDAELPGILSDLLDQAEHRGPRPPAGRTKISASVPTLIAGLADPDPQIGESAVWALHYCAPESLDPLIACLGHPDAFVRERAAHSLGNIGEVARVDAALALQRLLSDSDQAVRKRAAWALGLTRDNSESTLERLAALVSKGTPGDAESALHALGNIGKTAGAGPLSRYRQVVLAALDRPESTIRRWALYAAESTGLAPQEWAKVLVDVIRRDESSEVRAAALSDLKAVASMVDLAEAVPTLLARLADASREAMLVCGVLAICGPDRPRRYRLCTRSCPTTSS